MKKVFAILTALFCIAALTVSVAAAGTGSITLDNAVVGQTYAIYKMADLDSVVSGESYSYKYVAEWKAFFEAQSAYFTVTEDGYVNVKDVTLTDAQKAQLAKDALAYAKAENSGITAVGTITAESATIVFDELDLGYYVVDSSIGTLCTLDTIENTLTIQDKNEQPLIEKEVKEDSTGAWGEENDADFYQTVEFRTTITAKEGAQNYVLHDDMDEGLTLIAVNSVTLNDEAVENENDASYTVKTADITDGCDFEIVFTDAFCDSLADNDSIVVSYTAYLNEGAVIAGDGNLNETWLAYGDNANTNHEFTTTYVFEFDIVKTDDKNELLDGAAFKLYASEDGSDEIAVVKEADGSYRVAKDDETGVEIEVAGGKVTITGLDGSTEYWLEETQAPTGYNKLSAREGFTIESENLKATIDAETDQYTEGGVQIVNKSGALLPSTGGIGTIIFTVVGAALVLGAGVLLVTKKRMSKQG